MQIAKISPLLLSILGCSSLPTYRQNMELISIDQTGRLAVFRFSQGDTGWLKGTGHFKATIWNPDQNALEFWDHAPADHINWSDTEISIGARHTLRHIDGRWQLDSHFDEWNLRVMGSCSSEEKSWTINDTWSTAVHCPNMTNTGWTQSHEQSQLLKGNSLLISHKGMEPVDGMMFMAANPTLYFTLETTEDANFGEINFQKDGQWQTQPIKSIQRSSNGWLLETSTEQIQVDKIETIGTEDPHQHVMNWERNIASTVAPIRSIQWSKGRGVWNEKPFVVIIRKHSS